MSHHTGGMLPPAKEKALRRKPCKARCSHSASPSKAPHRQKHFFLDRGECHPIPSIRNTTHSVRGWQSLSVKGHGKYLGFLGHAQVCHYSAKAATDAMQMNECGCEPIHTDTKNWISYNFHVLWNYSSFYFFPFKILLSSQAYTNRQRAGLIRRPYLASSKRKSRQVDLHKCKLRVDWFDLSKNLSIGFIECILNKIWLQLLPATHSVTFLPFLRGFSNWHLPSISGLQNSWTAFWIG